MAEILQTAKMIIQKTDKIFLKFLKEESEA
jgi:hypothetical protein